MKTPHKTCPTPCNQIAVVILKPVFIKVQQGVAPVRIALNSGHAEQVVDKSPIHLLTARLIPLFPRVMQIAPVCDSAD